MTFGLVLMALAMLGATALAWGGFTLVRTGRDKPRGWLMIVAAVIVVGNVLILTV
jgi:predicted permease